MCVTLKQIQKVTSKFTLHDNTWEYNLTVTNVIIKQPQNKILKGTKIHNIRLWWMWNTYKIYACLNKHICKEHKANF